jgi:AcrR family transcriptional regulator
VNDPSQPAGAPKLVRGEPIVTRVLEATIEELALSGYAGLALERVAARAGVNRTTIFRRWPTKPELVRAALQRATGALNFDWDTGSLRGDLKMLIERAGETMLAPGMLGFLQTMLGARDEPELLELAAEAEFSKVAAVMAFFVRAEQRGELRPDLDKQLFLDGLMGLLTVKLVYHCQPVTPEFVERLLDHVILMVAPPKPVAHAPRPEPTPPATDRPARGSRKIKPKPATRSPRVAR